MDSESTHLVIRVHLADARIVTFAVADEREANRILEGINPKKFFDQGPLVMGCAESLTAFQTSLVVQVELISDELPSWPFHHNVRVVREVSSQMYRDLYASHKKADPQFGAVVQAFSIIELSNGERLYLALEINSNPAISPLTPLDHHVFLQQMFASGGMHVLRHNKGVILINPTHVARLEMHPGPGEVPPGGWHARLS